MIVVGVIGFGYWGPNIVRNIMSIEDMEVRYIADKNISRLTQAKNLYPSVTVTQELKEVLVDNRVNAIIIATPVSTHFQLAYDSLKYGKHLLVEKPLASSSNDCAILVDIAARKIECYKLITLSHLQEQ